MTIASSSIVSFTKMCFNAQTWALLFFPTSLTLIYYLKKKKKDGFSNWAEQQCYHFLVLKLLMEIGHLGHPVMVEIILQIEENIFLWFVT